MLDLAKLALQLQDLSERLEKPSPPHEGGWSARSAEARELADLAAQVRDEVLVR